MRSSSRAAMRLVLVPALAAAIASAGCAHAPGAGDGRSLPAEASGHERGDRVLVTGSRIPRPVGRDGLPVTDSPVRIYGREDLPLAAEPDLARALRKADVGAR